MILNSKRNQYISSEKWKVYIKPGEKIVKYLDVKIPKDKWIVDFKRKEEFLKKG